MGSCELTDGELALGELAYGELVSRKLIVGVVTDSDGVPAC